MINSLKNLTSGGPPPPRGSAQVQKGDTKNMNEVLSRQSGDRVVFFATTKLPLNGERLFTLVVNKCDL